MVLVIILIFNSIIFVDILPIIKLPFVYSSKPPTILSNVLFPESPGPRMYTISFFLKVTEISFKAIC